MMTANAKNTFLYFGYGSNLLTQRIRVFSPSAERYAIAKLYNHRLDFGYNSKKWRGMVATVVPDEGEHVWGAIWKLDMEDMKNLDRQESVHDNIYKPVYVEVETPDLTRINCRCYMLTKQPIKIPSDEPMPDDRKPSYSYLNVIIEGAIESSLPEYYIDKLKQIPHNGEKPDIRDIIGYETGIKK